MVEVVLGGEADTRLLGKQLAQALAAGDCMTLTGELGVGKTALARAIIQAAAGMDCVVPSPTFTLLQTYKTPKAEFWHFDLYRLGDSEEVLELGFEQAMQHIMLIEWPDRAGPYLPKNPVAVSLDFGTGETERIAHIQASQDWFERFDH